MAPREGSLDAPVRRALDWQDPAFFDDARLFEELERVFDICHGCRRCFNLCNAFPTLFDAIDESESFDAAGVPREVYWQVVDECYLCDMCGMTKCPYVPPHEWNVDFPQLMLRAKAKRYREQGASRSDRLLASTDAVGNLAGIPVVAGAVNAGNRSRGVRKLLDKTLGIAPDARLPEFHSKSLRKRLRKHATLDVPAVPAGGTRGKVALFSTCYVNRNEPDIGEDLVRVLEHNDIPVTLVSKEKCCGMPRLELGDLAGVDKLYRANVPELARYVEQGFDIVAPVPSCVLMFKQTLPMIYPDDEQVQAIAQATFDPFEYLGARHGQGALKTAFARSLGAVAYHAPCHLRVQNMGYKTREILELIPDTRVEVIERCSGHNGTYGVKSRSRASSVRIARPVIRRVEQAKADYFASDCPMAGHHVASGTSGRHPAIHPLTLLRMAYGLETKK